MKIIFFGTSSFAIPSLQRLARSGHQIVMVVTQPDREQGRHLEVKAPPVKEAATALGIEVFQPPKVSAPDALERLRAAGADLFVVVSFGQFLSESALALPRHGAVNLHASLLPKYRGAAPLNWAIINGERVTGVSVFRLEKKMDAGDIILDREVAIEERDTALSLGEKLGAIGAEVLLETVVRIDTGSAMFRKQDSSQVTFAPKLSKADGLIAWDSTAPQLHNRVRGLLPWPSAYTLFKGKILKVLETNPLLCGNHDAVPGQVVGIEPGIGILVKAGNGCLAIQRLQLEGAKPMGYSEFLRGHKIVVGDRLG
ncbi:MAG: methionyl-tRNA formyltransferase [Candidatus Omnitrophota bacterium]